MLLLCKLDGLLRLFKLISQDLLQAGQQPWPISKIEGLAAGYMLHFATPFNPPFAQLLTPHPQHEQLGVGRLEGGLESLKVWASWLPVVATLDVRLL